MLQRPLPLIALCVFWLVSLLLAPHAMANARHAALIVDANTGDVLHAENADELRYPASLTKMMTLYLVFEAIERGRATYGTRIKISAQAAAAAPTKLGLDPGEDIALIDAIKALITKSANDMAIAIAEHFAGTEAQFARVMTDKARAMGMTASVFRNASGLPDTGQVTTARDMVTLALRLYDDFPRHYALFSMRSFAFQGSTHKNHNNLLGRFPGVDGIKTGYTRMSGFNLVSSVRRGGRHVVGAVFGGATADRRDDAMRLLLTRAIVRASPIRRRAPRPVLVSERAAPRPHVASEPRVAAAVVPPWGAAAATVAPVAEVRVRPVMVAPRVRTVEAAPAEVPEPRIAARADRGGAAPSTLGQQANNIARGLPALTSGPMPAVRPAGVRFAEASGAPTRLRGADVPPVGAAQPGGFEIQVGAYGSAPEADRMLSAVREKAKDLLAPFPQRAIGVQRDNRQLYRARFTGFNANSAATTCQELRRRQVDCFVMKAE